MQSAEIRKESELPKKRPNGIRTASHARPAQESADGEGGGYAVWVRELAVCSSSLVAIEGKNRRAPLVKEGEASMSRALSTLQQPRIRAATVRIKPMATTAAGPDRSRS